MRDLKCKHFSLSLPPLDFFHSITKGLNTKPRNEEINLILETGRNKMLARRKEIEKFPT